MMVNILVGLHSFTLIGWIYVCALSTISPKSVFQHIENSGIYADCCHSLCFSCASVHLLRWST